MNKFSRQEIKSASEMLAQALELINNARDIIENASEFEREKFDNANEGLQSTERFRVLEENADTMDYLIYILDDVISNLEDATEHETFEL